MPRAASRTALALATCLCLLPVWTAGAATETPPDAQVVVIVDTSGSMKRPTMDPQRRSLLVTRLLADLVPGDLAAVRLLDLSQDIDLLPSRPTGETIPCQEDPSQRCQVVEPTTDWATAAFDRQLGLLARPRRGDANFKEQLADHLAQRSHNSPFSLAFRAARGFFDARSSSSSTPRFVIWLSDGKAESPQATAQEISQLLGEGVHVEAFIFGRGDTALAEQTGTPVYRIETAGGLMHAFADAFRRIVGAPYRVDQRVADQPSFELQPAMEEVWVVVYGDDSLRGASVRAPDGSDHPADYAADSWPGAGAYRVAYLEDPRPGRWQVHADGGGPGTAYAVIQRSTLVPSLVAPQQAVSGVPVALVATILGGREGRPLQEPELLRDAALTAEVEGRSVTLRDDGKPPDVTAGDGRFSAEVTFQELGSVAVSLHLSHPLVERSVEASVQVAGRFRYVGGPAEVDLGTLRAGDESCRPLRFDAEHRGRLPFELRSLRELPAGHRLELRTPSGALATGGGSLDLVPDTPIEICLVSSRRAASSRGSGPPQVELALAGKADGSSRQAVPIALRWQLRELSFWERWGRLLLLLLALALLVVVVLGFVLPHRFSPTLAVAFAPDRRDLDDYPAQALRRWKGVRSGFYRHARAYLHSNFRVSGRPRGALASLLAEARAARIVPVRGSSLFRETVDGDWEPVAAGGRAARGGDVYRIGDRGPFFRISTRPGGRG